MKQYPKGMFCKIKNIFYLCCWSVMASDIFEKVFSSIFYVVLQVFAVFFIVKET